MMKKCGTLLVCLLLCGSMALAQTDNEREVVATGVGMTEDDAKKQAYRAAVQNVVGAMVVSETLVLHDDLVEEKILSYSDGYVTKAEQISATKALEGGLMSVTLKVTVRSDQLKEKLITENLITMAADGEQFLTQRKTEQENRLAQETTSQEAQENAATIVTEAIKELPAALLDATADFSQVILKGDGGGSTVSVVIPVTVSVNQERYAKFISQFKKILKDLGAEYKTLTVQNGTDRPQSPGRADLSTFDLRWKDDIPGHSVYIMAINELTDFEGNHSRWTVYYFAREVLEAFNIHRERTWPVVVVELLDEEGNIIVEQEFDIKFDENPCTVMFISSATAFNAALIAPSVGGNTHHSNFFGFAAKSGTVFKPTFTLSNEELKRVKSIRCGVRNNFK